MVVLTLLICALAAVLLASAVLKLGRSRQTVEAMVALGVPAALRRMSVARVVPALETVGALALLLAPWPLFTIGAIGSVLLFALFTALTARVLMRGARVSCACFGALSEEPVGRLSLVRDVALLLCALAVAVFSRQGALLGMLDFATAEWTQFFGGAALVLACGLVAALAFLVRRRTPEAEPTDRGAPWPIPEVEVTDATGRSVLLSSVAQNGAVLLVLLSAECTPCRTIAASIPSWRTAFGSAVEIAVLTSEEPDLFDKTFPELGVRRFLGLRSLVAVTGIRGTPAALLLAPDRTVAAGPALGSDEIAALAADIASVVPHGVVAPFSADVTAQ